MTGTDTSRPVVDRQVRARFTEETITVYQAYPPAVADAALAAGTFVAPFKHERMAWIKPSSPTSPGRSTGTSGPAVSARRRPGFRRRSRTRCPRRSANASAARRQTGSSRQGRRHGLPGLPHPTWRRA
ncbi:DUF4291 family protein [Streptomyces glaucosporus]|uniref:DUF4291 family protein n=1 Tax=Streptomyces glaucosporus TaxID=284044 RepID=UPI003CD059FD